MMIRFLVQWIRDNLILENLYRDNLHPELVKRCVEIPIFLAKENEMTTKDIDLIWNAGVDKHEAVTHSIYSLLNSLSPNLNIEHINYLFNLVKSIPLDSYDSHIIQLVRSITFYGFSLGNQAELYGLGTMWDIVQDECNVSSEIKTLAFTLLHDFIPWKLCFQFRIPLIARVMENLKNHRSSCASMKILGNILSSYLLDQPPVQNLPTLLTQLNEEFSLLELFFNDLESYKKLVNEQIQNNANLKEHPETWNTTCFTKLPHLQEIQERLQFLQHILQKSNLTLSQSDIDIFWASLVSGSITPEEKEAALKWLEFRENDYGNPIYSDEVFLYLFEKKIVELDTENLSMEGLNLVFSFFKSINFKNGSLQKDPKQESVEFCVHSFDLVGMRFLWEICLTVKKPDVSKRAIFILFSLQKSVSPELLNQIETQRRDFIKFCMDQLAETSNGALDERKELRILRCLSIINSYVEEFDPKELPIKRHGSIGKGKTITLKVVVANKQNLNFSLEIFQNDTVRTLKEKVGAQLNTNPNMIRIITSGKDLNVDTRTLDSYGVTSGQAINAISVPRRLKDNQQVTSFEFSPSYILSGATYFEQIFNLLSLTDIVSKKAWELLMLLPTNEVISNELLNSDSPNWQNILSVESLYKLLYSLQIIESIVDTQGATAQEVEKKNAWGSKFHEQGGINYLMDIITSDLHKTSRPKSKTCIALIFQIIVHFIHRLGNDFGNPSLVVEKILDITFNSSSSEYPGMEDATIVEHSLELFIFYCYTPAIFKSFLQYPRLSEWLFQSLVLCRNTKIREHVQKAIEHLCSAVPVIEEKSTVSNFFEVLLSFLPSISTKLNTYGQYFDLFNYVIRAIKDDENLRREYEEKFETIVGTLVETLKNHPIIEKDNKTDDTIIIGLLKILRALIVGNNHLKEKYGSELVEELYSHCLFEFPSVEDHDRPILKCKSKLSRIMGFRLLHELSKNNKENFLSLAKKLIPHHDTFSAKDWHYSPAQLEKSTSGFVGLANLGATCYLNSLMQQFFMNPKFRRGFLSLPPPNEPEDENENFFYQLQKLFAHLQEGQKKFYTTEGFCKSYIDYSGQPINPGIQMDADEFFNMLFEKLENALKGTGRDTFLRDFFGGKVCNQVISKECDHVSENFEDYYTISVPVKGKNTLEEAFDLYVEGDLLEGDNKYHCGTCNAKVDALRRCCIAELPNNLIVHMRRFEFDIEELRRMKVNDFCQFPHQLNLEPYTKEGLARKEAEKAGKEVPEVNRPNSYYQYELVGVLVHTGTADSGHYYSFIKDREKNQNSWYQFNDRDVDPFDEKDIPSSCFGGYENSTQWDSNLHKYVQQYRQKMDNAYMLFYQRIQPEPTSSDNLGIEAKLPDQIYNSIWQENVQFFIDKYVFDKDYFTFLLHFLKSSKFEEDLSIDSPINLESPAFRSIELGTRFLVQTLSHAKFREQLNSFLEILSERYATNLPACKWFISTAIQDNWTKEFLVACPDSDARDAFSILSSKVLATLSPFERHIYPLTLNSEEERDLSYYVKVANSSEIAIDKFNLVSSIEEELFKSYIKDYFPAAHSLWYIESLTKELKYLRHNWRNIEQYFAVFKEFSKLGDDEKSYLLHRSVISRFVDFYLGDDSGLTANTNFPKRMRLGDKFRAPSLGPMVELFADIICRTQLTEHVPPSLTSAPLPLTDLDKHFINIDGFYHRVLTDNINVEKVAEIIAHVSWENTKFSSSVLTIMMYTDENSIQPYLIVLSKLLKLNDSLQQWRIEYALDHLWKLLENGASMMFFNIVRFLSNESSENVQINNWMYSIINKWIAKWLIIHNFDHVRGATEELIQVLIYADQKEQIIDEERKSAIFTTLLDLLPVALNHTKIQPFSFPVSQVGEEYHYQCSPYKLLEYFRLLRTFITTRDHALALLEHLDTFLSIFDLVEGYQNNTDENKGQIIRVIDHIMEIDIEFCKYFLSKKNFQKKLLEYYISLGSDEPNILYNNTTLQVFFRIIKKCCTYNQNFLNAFINHKNFNWSFEFICLAEEFHLAGHELFESVKLYIDDDQHFRQKIILIIINSDKSKIKTYHYRASIDYFNQCTQNLEDIVYFCQHGGLDFLSMIDNLRSDFEYDAPSLAIAEPALNLLAKVTEWMAPEYTSSNQDLANWAMEISQSWESKMDLFLQLQSYLNSLTMDSILAPTYKILYNLSSSDETILEIVLGHLETEHENNYFAKANSKDLSYITGPKKPCVKAHLLQFSGAENIGLHEDYYLFLRRICEYALNRYFNDAAKSQIVINLLIFAFIEVIPSLGIHATFIELLASQFAQPYISGNKFLDEYVYRVLTTESHVLESQECFSFIRESFAKVINLILSVHFLMILILTIF